ncbi:MAG: hypothetical protein JWM41_2912 [Gemmatimonadetes bacterium]|nr:hypothetical protein [Gemmatimonadota bacterium]
MADILSVPSFGGGVVLEGSADAQRTDEVQAADSYDIGPRGQLVAASDKSNFFNVQDGATHPLTQLYGMDAAQVPQGSFLIAIGDFSGNTYISTINIDGSSPGGTSTGAVLVGGISATFAEFPFTGVVDGKQKRVVLICLGARSGQNPRQAAGLYALVYDQAGPSYALQSIVHYDALGTGTNGEFPGGTRAAQLYPRGVIAYNNFAFLWGFDNHDATNGDGPNRLMFSNLGNPLKYGLDPAPLPAVEADRAFTDSDAFTIGGAGEVIRAGCVWDGKLWLGTNQGLHYVAGFGRESFLTNGALPTAGSKNVIGPHCLIEGPDRLLHGVSDEGHWIFNGGTTDPVFLKLHNFAGKSPGYFDQVWSDPSQAAGFPGKTNQDLVWMLSVPELMQVWIVIPFCSIANGYGQGTDTIIIKYHCLTGGYTRQLFPNMTMAHGVLYRRDQTGPVQTFVCGTNLSTNLIRYGYRASGAASPVMCSVLPDATLGEYAPHGPDGVGVSRKLYLTLSWESSSLPLVFTVTPTVDQKPAGPAIVLTIGAVAPVGPLDGDTWVDTSGTDTNLGNGTAGSFTPASPADFIVKRWAAGRAKWDYMPVGGEQGTRMSVPIAYTPHRGSRVKYRVQCTSAAGRFQIEGVGLEPTTIRSDR